VGKKMNTIKPWDLAIRIFHWSLAAAFLANVFIIDDDSLLHKWVGYTALGLISGRIIWGFAGPARARFASFPPSLTGALEHLHELTTNKGTARPHFSHNPLGALMVYNLLVTLILVGLTGYLMTTSMFWGYGWLEDVHELLSNWALFSVFAHVAGVIFESRRLGVNLVKAMVRGESRNAGDAGT
jgi:cytochrome b